MDGSWDMGIMFLKHIFSGLSAFHGWSISLKTNCLATFLAPGEGMCIRIQSHVFRSALLHMHLSMQFYLCFHITSVIIFWAAVWPSDWEFKNHLTWYTVFFLLLLLILYWSSWNMMYNCGFISEQFLNKMVLYLWPNLLPIQIFKAFSRQYSLSVI